MRVFVDMLCNSSIMIKHLLFQAIGEFVLTNPDIKMKPRGKLIYSVNEGNSAYFEEPMKKYLQMIKNPTVSTSCCHDLQILQMEWLNKTNTFKWQPFHLEEVYRGLWLGGPVHP